MFFISIHISHVVNLEDVKKLSIVNILLDVPRVQQGDVETDLIDVPGRGGRGGGGGGRGGRRRSWGSLDVGLTIFVGAGLELLLKKSLTVVGPPVFARWQPLDGLLLLGLPLGLHFITFVDRLGSHSSRRGRVHGQTGPVDFLLQVAGVAVRQQILQGLDVVYCRPQGRHLKQGTFRISFSSSSSSS